MSLIFNHLRILKISIPFLLLIGIVILSYKIDLHSADSILSKAIIFDLLITIPVAYFFTIRKTKIPLTTLVPVLILCTVIGFLIIPEKNQYYLQFFKVYALPVFEIVLISYVIYKVRIAFLQLKKNTSDTPDFYEALLKTCKEIIPNPFLKPFAAEIAIIYYGFFKWKSPELKVNQFSFHKSGGSIALLSIIILLIISETFILHILLVKWNVAVAWILSALSIYSGIQIFGLIKSIPQRPSYIDEEKIVLRYGVFNEAEIPFSNIESIEISSRDLPEEKTAKNFSVLGKLDSHNLIIHLKKEAVFNGYYGLKIKYRTLGIFIDQKQEFVNAVNDKLNV
ncbi:hypothetical protein OO013_04240 [Mangrovivirga sp. M17]|uniref:Uncharacterized protein n=1 Tax=Mangrovivirga halotolerans TaxID=2993936 RepID=A0ABT3RMS5_9BACT|nr:hypothetical protein [Mangrovivirga halotolerans]MCX2743059.1 hypothetical protein [Mangrovivirga halotolerans]